LSLVTCSTFSTLLAEAFWRKKKAENSPPLSPRYFHGFFFVQWPEPARQRHEKSTCEEKKKEEGPVMTARLIRTSCGVSHFTWIRAVSRGGEKKKNMAEKAESPPPVDFYTTRSPTRTGGGKKKKTLGKGMKKDSAPVLFTSGPSFHPFSLTVRIPGGGKKKAQQKKDFLHFLFISHRKEKRSHPEGTGCQEDNLFFTLYLILR